MTLGYVIIHCQRWASIEAQVLGALADRRNHNVKYKDHPLMNPTFLLSPLNTFAIHRFPPCGGGMPLSQLKQCADEVEKVLFKLKNTFNGCGWFKGIPEIKIVNFETDPNQANVLCEPGTEYLYPLAVSSKQVADWIFDGSVASGKVLLCKARTDLDRYLNPAIDCFLVGLEAMIASNAEVIVFYCNNANSHSPDYVQMYNRWFRERHPDSKQRCVMLESGVNGLYHYLKETKYSDEDRLKVLLNVWRREKRREEKESDVMCEKIEREMESQRECLILSSYHFLIEE